MCVAARAAMGVLVALAVALPAGLRPNAVYSGVARAQA
jgi:hypothetical protein